MFANSTQLKYWTFCGTTELSRLREEANKKYISKHAADFEESHQAGFFLTAQEERLIVRHYEYVLKDFCENFQPFMPKFLMATAMMYFKRFYLHNSVMDYHPKYIVYTCVYLACKVDEFYVPITQFVENLQGEKERTADVLLAQELLLMQQLHYHLTVYSCYRPLEGLLIDIKTRCPEIATDKIRKGAETFIDRSMNTDVSLLFAPSQIAVAAVLSGGSKVNINLDSYVTTYLLGSCSKESLVKTVEHIKRIRYMVKHMDPLERDVVRALEVRLERCLNPANNPDSGEYKESLQNLFDEEDERRMEKHQKIAEEMRREEEELVS